MYDIKCVYIEPQRNPMFIPVYFGFDTRNNTPTRILGAEPTILGANPDHDLVLLGICQTDVYHLPLNTNNMLDSFNKDDNIRGPLLIMKTDEGGDPIDCDVDL